MTGRKSTKREKAGKKTARAGRQATVYGDRVSICTNAKCMVRKNARCYGYEGCPGFSGR